MTLDPKMKKSLSAFTRWWAGQRARLGAALDSHTAELKATTPTRPGATWRHRKSYYDEATTIRIPAADEDIETSTRTGEALQDAWRRGETNISLVTGQGRAMSSEGNDRFRRAPHVVPGPDPYAPVVTIHEAEVYKTERTLYMVMYRLDDAEGWHSAGPYLTEEIAREHADDIRKLEGVSDCHVAPLFEPEKST